MNSDFIITKEEHTALSFEMKALKEQTRELNWKLNNDPNFIKSFSSIEEYTRWRKDATETVERNKARMNHLREIASVYKAQAEQYNRSKGIHEERRRRAEALKTSVGIIGLIIDARHSIEDLNELLGDNWRTQDSLVCRNLRDLELRLLGDKELSGWKSPSEVVEIRRQFDARVEAREQQYKQDVARLQRKIAELEAELNRERTTKGRAAQVLRQLRDSKLPEIEDWRLRRGYVFRIHLDKSLSEMIDEVL